MNEGPRAFWLAHLLVGDDGGSCKLPTTSSRKGSHRSKFSWILKALSRWNLMVQSVKILTDFESIIMLEMTALIQSKFLWNSKVLYYLNLTFQLLGKKI